MDNEDIFEGNTVGCTVMLKGNVAAATSTGGMTYKLDGRIGDSPIIGAGTYANNKYGAISCTGIGEEFIKHVTAYDIIARVKYCKISLQQAIEDHLEECFESGVGGAIAVDKCGQIGIAFNTTGMIRGYLTSKNKQNGYVAILNDDTQTVEFDKQLSIEDEQKIDMDETQNMQNPYIDASLLQQSTIYSPAQNQTFESLHAIKKSDND